MVLYGEEKFGIQYVALSERFDRQGTRARLSKSKMAAAEGELCFDVVAVLPAGGSGVRMNLRLPKQVRSPSPLNIILDFSHL